MKKAGITIDLSLAFWANGLQQNVVFLYEMLERVGGIDPYYISQKPPKQRLMKKHKGLELNELLKDDSFVLDYLFICGFDLLDGMYDILKKRNPNLKVILIHYGSKCIDDIHYSTVVPHSSKGPLSTPKYLSQVWISPHHEFSSSYIKTYYNTNDVVVSPYIWDSFFVEEALKPLKSKKQNLFDPKKISNVCIFEPNKTHVKHCLLPIMICERTEQNFPGTINQVNSFCCESLRKNHYFEKLMNRLSINDAPSKCYFNNRWNLISALLKFGNTIVSNQINNELNYLYLEVLHLGLPLIHNSKPLSEVGYYYPDFDLETGSNQLKLAIETHANELDWYKGHSRSFLQRYSPYNEKNISIYKGLL